MARQGYPSDKQDQFMLRLPDGMRDRIRAAAEVANRSMNAEIVATLEEKYPAPDPLSQEQIEAYNVAIAEISALVDAPGGVPSQVDLDDAQFEALSDLVARVRVLMTLTGWVPDRTKGSYGLVDFCHEAQYHAHKLAQKLAEDAHRIEIVRQPHMSS